jgi:citrate synthase
MSMTHRHFLSAAEAAAALRVRSATLYAYVSRGLLRSEVDPEGRGRRYPAEEVEALARRAAGRRDPRQVARGALDWGLPVLDSRLTLIADGRIYYRGLDAVELTRTGETLERVAALLWLGDLAAPLPPAAPGRLAVLPRLEAQLVATRSWRPFQRLQALLPFATAEDPAAYDLRPPAVIASGAWLIQLSAAIAAATTRGLLDQTQPASAAAQLAAAWSPPAGAGECARKAGVGRARATAVGGGGSGSSAAALRRLLEAALILCADHELNVSAFTARCVASAGAPPQAAVAAGLAALGGSRHGGQTERVEALLDEVSPTAIRSVSRESGSILRDRLADRLRRGEEIPGFGHPLYRDGDPRARLLLDLAAASRPRSPHLEAASELAAAALELLGERPNLDFGLVTLARTLGLPPGAPLALFAVGRSAGWIAHVIEQYGDSRLIRPRARYTGPEPYNSATSVASSRSRKC